MEVVWCKVEEAILKYCERCSARNNCWLYQEYLKIRKKREVSE